MFDFDQNATEKTQIVPTFAKANHSAQHIFLSLLLLRLVDFPDVELLRDGDQGFQHARAERVLHPS